MRGCWEAGPLTEIAQPARPRIERAPTPRPAGDPVPATGRLDFIPVGPAPRTRARRTARPRGGTPARTPDLVLGFWGEEP